jgi:hypothetical protein
MEILFFGNGKRNSCNVKKKLDAKKVIYTEVPLSDMRYHINTYPTILLLNDDREVFARWVGPLSDEALESLCDLSQNL